MPYHFKSRLTELEINTRDTSVNPTTIQCIMEDFVAALKMVLPEIQTWVKQKVDNCVEIGLTTTSSFKFREESITDQVLLELGKKNILTLKPSKPLENITGISVVNFVFN